MAEAETSPVGATRAVGAARLAIGLVQGFVAYWLYWAAHIPVWPATNGPLFGAFALATAFTPLVVLAGLGHLRRPTLLIWALVAWALAAMTAAHSVASALPSGPIGARPPFTILPAFPVVAFTAAALFIIHHLVVSADRERRLIARYPGYFDAAWLNGVQLILAIAFTVAFWIVLELGAALFALIGVHGFRKLISHAWFYFPVTGLAFAAAAHLADVRVNLTRGLRTVGLILLSWLLPVMTLIAAAFLLALPFTGLAPLWKAGSATAIVLGAMAALIILVNASYQDGEHAPAPVLRWSARLTGVILVPLAGLAFYGLWLRIGQHGLTPERIIAAACALVGAVYALGYAYAAVRPGRWMAKLELTNVAAAVLIVALVVALFTPIADPSRLAAADQVARLERGKVDPSKFDFKLLRFRTGRYGVAGLKRLAARKAGGSAVFAPMAAAALKMDELCQWSDCIAKPAASIKITVFPAGQTLPADFVAGILPADVNDCALKTSSCEAYLIDLRHDGQTEVLLRSHPSGDFLSVYAKTLGQAGWSRVGQFYLEGCSPLITALRSGTIRPVAPIWPDLEAGGSRLLFRSDAGTACDQPKTAAPVSSRAHRPATGEQPAAAR